MRLLFVAFQNSDGLPFEAAPRDQTLDQRRVGARCDVHPGGFVEVAAEETPDTRRLGGLQLVRLLHRDEGAAPLADLDQPLTLQAGVESHHGFDVETGEGGHPPQRREPLAVPQETGVQSGNDLVASLVEKALLAHPIEADPQGPLRSRLPPHPVEPSRSLRGGSFVQRTGGWPGPRSSWRSLRMTVSVQGPYPFFQDAARLPERRRAGSHAWALSAVASLSPTSGLAVGVPAEGGGPSVTRA